MNKNKRFIGLIIISLLIAILLSAWFIGNRKDGREDRIEQEEIIEGQKEKYIVVFKLEDYTDTKEVYEVRFFTESKKKEVYKDGIFYMNSSIKDSTELDIEEDNIPEDNTKIDIERHKTENELLFNMDRTLTKLYVEQIVKENYNLLRKIINTRYTEYYLINKENSEVLRIIATKDKAIIGNIKEGIELKEINTYFR